MKERKGWRMRKIWRRTQEKGIAEQEEEEVREVDEEES